MDARIKAAAQDRSTGATRLNIDIDPAKYGFDTDEKLDLSTYKVDPRAGCCPGCGASFQVCNYTYIQHIDVHSIHMKRN
jgi:hypothetical protein